MGYSWDFGLHDLLKGFKQRPETEDACIAQLKKTYKHLSLDLLVSSLVQY